MRAALGLAAVHAANMNGNYSIASGTRQDVPYNTDFATKGMEYFDIWGPEIATLYGQVFWADQLMQPLPPDIVKRFTGKTIAVTGYEHDQVMVSPVGQPGVNPDKDVSVPMNWAYNHHYQFWLTGKNAQMMWVPAAKGDQTAHGMQRKLVAVDRPSDDSAAGKRLGNGIPTSSYFSEGNGGESRKSYHGFPKGFAQLIDMPEQWHVFPMQVDVRNRECGVTPADVHNCSGSPGSPYRPGLEPKQARWGQPWNHTVGTNVSGLLECPCNSRYGGDPAIYGANTKTKRTEHKFMASPNGCLNGEALTTPVACFEAAAAIGSSVLKNVTTSNPGMPDGCSLEYQSDSGVIATFNQGGKTPCTMTNRLVGSTTIASTGVGLKLEMSIDPSKFAFARSKPGLYCSDQEFLAHFVAASGSTEDSVAALTKCEDFCGRTATCWGCSVQLVTPPDIVAFNALPACGEQMAWTGKIVGDISERVAVGNLTMTITGPASQWFAVGFNAQRMADQPWTVICNGTAVFENQIGTCGDEGQHCPGTRLNSSIQLLSNTVTGTTRTLVISRSLQGPSQSPYYSFNPARNSTIDIISAVGSSETFQYHAKHDLGSITVVNVDGTPTCVCDVGFAGLLCDNNGENCAKFVKGCVPEPDADLSAQQNPTCNSASYVGGLSCCGHERIMLDVDQDPGTTLLRYHVKIRIWFQEYVPATARSPPSHYDLTRIYYQTEAFAGEYDVPPAFFKPGAPTLGYSQWPAGKMTPGTSCTGTCPDGPDCDCIHTIHYHWTVPQMRLIYAGGHCHAPSCVDMTLYRNDTGEIICAQIPKYGNGTGDKFSEPNFLELPPCLWGPDEGLNPSVLLPNNTPLLSIKRNRNTFGGHFGEMASWQMRGVDF